MESSHSDKTQQGNYFFLIFALLLLVLFTLELLSVVQTHIVNPWTYFLSKIGAAIILLFDDGVIAYQQVIQNTETGFAVAIAPGCNGIEAVIVLLAAILAYPATIKDKLLGISIGIIAIQLMNIVRIISLFYLGQYNETLFDWAHSYIWQALIMLDVLIVYLFWLRRINKSANA